MENAVQMAVDQAKLVAALKHSFTNTTTVLAELMQNARRAGSRYVRFDFDPDSQTLSITDEGCGIESVEDLLTVAASGWDEAVVETDHPYGIGFLSALYACERIEIASKGFTLAAQTQDILAFKPVSVVDNEGWDGKTVIRLIKVRMPIDSIERALEGYAQGYPIPVVMNGKALSRLYALDSRLEFSMTEVGHVSIDMDVLEKYGVEALRVFVQGIQVYQSRYLGMNSGHVVHLNSSFRARLPDRDKLIDEAEVIHLVRASVKALISERFEAMKQNLSAMEFAGCALALDRCGLLALLNDVPVVSQYHLIEYVEYPNCYSENFGAFAEMPKAHVPKEDIVSGKVSVVRFSSEMYDETGGIPFIYIFQKGFLVLNERTIDDGHWLCGYVRNLDNEEWDMTLNDETQKSYFYGEWSGGTVTFCRSYVISYGGDPVECDVPVFSDLTGFVVPESCSEPERVLSQAESYNSEHEDFQSGVYEVDKAAFRQFFVANTEKDPVVALKALLPGYLNCPTLFGNRFLLELNDGGKIEVKAA